jgi:5-methylcytosine-specific restriction endonuclease McrBC GTP-binding regulatory subunit McrB
MSTIAEKIDEVLKSGEKSIVLTGAPGTGKTYAVKQYVANRLFKIDWKEVKEDDPRVKLVQFHQSYDYTDFIEGFRPDPLTDEFKLKPGIFKEFCEIAKNSESVHNAYVDNFDESWDRLTAEFSKSDKKELIIPSAKQKKPNKYQIGKKSGTDRKSVV